MAVIDTINSIKQHIEDAYGIAEEKQAVIPEQKNLANLADCVASISGSEDLDTELNDYKNGLDTEDIKIEDIVNAIRDKTGAERLSVEEKDINFYDYDGTCVYSYTLDEFQNVQELPQGPTHEGLIFQEWNWDLQDIKDENGCVDIGATYTTDDGCTRIYIELPIDGMNPALAFYVNGKCRINWGDGSFNDLETTSLTYKSTRHLYQKSGNYIISIDVIKGYIDLKTSSTTAGYGSNLFWNAKTGTTASQTTYYEYNREYQVCVKKIEIGNNVHTLGNMVISKFKNLSIITISKDVSIDAQKSIFGENYNLKYISFPKNSFTNAIASQFFFQTYLEKIILPKTPEITFINAIGYLQYCYCLKKIILHTNITRITDSSFSNTRPLTKVIFNANITSIGTLSFSQCYDTLKYDFTHNTQVPTLYNTNAFQYINPNCKIVVPNNLYDKWITTANWSDASIVSHIVKESEYNG